MYFLEIRLNIENDERIIEDLMQDEVVENNVTPPQAKEIHITEKKHAPLIPCENCRLQCSNQIAEGQRTIINKSFWSLKSWTNKKAFFTSHIIRKEISRRTAVKSKRMNVFQYYLPNDKGISVQICRTFFLTTLGFKKNNLTAIRNALKNMDPITLEPASEVRGTKRSQEGFKKRENAIRQHVESYQPNVSHYQRSHAPKCRYLPSEITIKQMVDNFKEIHPENITSNIYDVYRTVLKDMNISFTKLGHEECEKCEIFNHHDALHDKNNLSPSCDTCNNWIVHQEKAKEARILYQQHCKESSANSEAAFYSADLQKVIMLPWMPGYKPVQFTRRIIAFNESFIPLYSTKGTNRPFAVLWNENVSGRKKENLISAFYSFFLFCRDKKHVVIWLDNCSGQN